MARCTAAVLVLASAAVLAIARPLTADDRTRANVRPAPRVSQPGRAVLLVLELSGGPDREDLYCPQIAWDFGDGDTTSRESDCEAWQPGTAVDRRFSIWHSFRGDGEFEVTVALWRAGRKLVETGTRVRVVPGSGRRADMGGF